MDYVGAGKDVNRISFYPHAKDISRAQTLLSLASSTPTELMTPERGCPLVGGLIYDHFDSYAWLCIGSWRMGLAAFCIATTFRRFAKREERGLEAAE